MFGVLNLNKPAGITSRDAVNVVQRMVKPAKVGHAGTLDPMATGVLLVCVGSATRLISILQQAPKTYVAEFRFGETSDTDDSTGTVELSPEAAVVERSDLQAELVAFTGTIDQVPPAFSAVKIKGQRAYAKARRGEDVQLSSKQVDVYSIELLEYQWPVAQLEIRCGSGTYIRSIARDLGKQLGCGGLMSCLERTAIGEFDVQNAVLPDALTPENLPQQITDALQIVSHLPKYRCSDDDLLRLQTGRVLPVFADREEPSKAQVESENQVAIISDDGSRLLALGEYIHSKTQIQPRAVFKE